MRHTSATHLRLARALSLLFAAVSMASLIGMAVASAPVLASYQETPAAQQPGHELRVPVGPLYGPVAVTAVRDGDTLVVASNVGPRTVRLIGIDAPETSAGEPLGDEATMKLRRLLGPAMSVWLELDFGTDDVYGRLLAYVYAADPTGNWVVDGVRASQANLEMVASGWAGTMAILPNVTYADLYDGAQAAAEEARLGLWGVAPTRAADTPANSPERGDSSSRLPLATGSSSAISLHCALINPSTPNDTAGEWVSVWLDSPLDTRGYYLHDEGSKQDFRLPNGAQAAGEVRVANPGQGVWNNGGDVIYLMRGAQFVDSWAYNSREVSEDEVLCR